MIRRMVFIMMSLLIMALILSACQPTSENTVNLRRRIVTLDMERPEEGTALARHLQGIAAKYNINFNFHKLYSSSIITKEELILNGIKEGRSPVDILMLDSYLLYSLVAHEALYPLNEMVDSQYWQELPPYLSVVEEFVKINGILYALPVEPAFMQAYLLFYNQDILEKEGIPDIYDLQQSGDWTLDTMLNIVKKVAISKEQVSFGGGISYKTVYTGSESGEQGGIYYQYLDLVLNGLHNVKHLEQLADGTIKIDYSSDNHIKALQCYSDFYPYTFSLKAYSTIYIDYFRHIKDQAEQIAFVGLPKKNQRDNNIILIDNCRVAAIPVTEQNPEIMVKIAQEIFQPQEEYERIVYELQQLIADQDRFEVLLAMLDNCKVIDQSERKITAALFKDHPREMLIIDNLYYSTIDQVVFNGKNPGQAMKELQIQVEEIINKIPAQ